MATNKASAKKSTSSRTTAAKKTTTKKTVTAKAATTSSAVELKVSKKASVFPLNLPNIILAELLGTFILTIVAFAAFAFSPIILSKVYASNWLADSLFVGLTLAVIAFAVGAVSGAHVNPAVTFGLWVSKKLKMVMVPVYWASQFLGALLAVGVINVLTNGQFAISLSNFTQFSTPLFFIELIGVAIFVFGVVSVVAREELSAGVKAFGIGLSLTVGLLAGTAMLGQVQKAELAKYNESMKNVKTQEEAEKIKFGRTMYMNGPVLNPAVALAVSEDSTTTDRLTQSSSETNTAKSSRFGLEVIAGDLVGAALGAGLFMLVAYRPKDEA